MEIVGVVVALLAAVLAAVLIGRSLPVGHVASRTITLRASPEQVWAAIADPDAARSPGGVRYEDVESAPSRRLVRRVVGDKDFGGSWTYEIVPAAGGATLTITERGEVYNPFFRFVSRFIIGHDRTIDGFLATLRVRFGEIPS